LKELELLGTSLAKVSLPKDEGRKKRTHHSIEDVVLAVARIMIKNSVMPVKRKTKSNVVLIVKRNKQFEGIIGIVFKTLKVKASPQVVIDKSWHDIRAYEAFGEEWDADLDLE
jgi:hypothetical protein